MIIEKAMVQMEGINISGFPSIDLFVYLMTPQLEKLKEPALDLLNEVFQQLEMLAHNIIDKLFMRFPAIKTDIMDIVSSVLIEERDHTRSIIEDIIEAEQNYIFTNDLAFKESKSGKEEIAQYEP